MSRSEVLERPDHPVAVVLSALTSLSADAEDAPMYGLSEADLVTLAGGYRAAAARLSALHLRVVREIDVRDLARSQGARTTTTWLLDRLRLPHGSARDLVELATRFELDPGERAAAGRVWAEVDAGGSSPGRRSPLGLDAGALEDLAGSGRSRMPVTAVGLWQGRLDLQAAGVVRWALDQLGDHVGPDQRIEAEAFLATQAAMFDARRLRVIARHLVTVLERSDASTDDATGSPGSVDEDQCPEQSRLAQLEERARARATLSFVDEGDGSVRVSGRLSADDHAVVAAALGPLSRPRPDADGTADPRSLGRRTADAVVQLCQLAMDHGQILPGSRGARPHVIVTASLDTLLGVAGAAAAQTPDGTPLSREALTRIACDARVTRVLAGPTGLPLDVGRDHRLVTPAQWTALVVRDGGCAHPGCTAPPTWCDAHHIVPWSRGGRSDLDNYVMLCRHHHTVIHQGGWLVRLAADGRPEFVPPPWVDVDRSPRRNSYHHVRTAVTSRSVGIPRPPPSGADLSRRVPA